MIAVVESDIVTCLVAWYFGACSICTIIVECMAFLEQERTSCGRMPV